MITKEPKNKNVYTKSFYFVKAARIAFSHILKCIFSDTDKKILMPSYIGETDEEGSGVFDPVRQNKVPYEFYIIRNNLSADFEDLKRKIISGKFKAMLVIHYFGFVQNNLEEIYSLCKKHEVILIEDCAHSFFSSYKGRNIGSWGDLSFFSIHKIIATPDGGYFNINNNDTGVTELIFDNQNVPSSTLEEYIRTDYEKVNKIRIENYRQYLRNWEDINGVYPLYPELPEGIIPLNFPIIVKNGLREKLYFDLVEKGIVPCSLYYRMVEEIDKNLYPISYEISSSILNLPVHQDTSLADIDRVVFEVRQSMEKIHSNIDNARNNE